VVFRSFPPAFSGSLSSVLLFGLLFQCFFHGRSPVSRLRVEATGAGGRSVRSRTEGCSQAFGVLRPTMVLSARVQSRIGGVTPAKSSNPLDLRPPARVAALTGSAGDVEPDVTVCPAPVAE